MTERCVGKGSMDIDGEAHGLSSVYTNAGTMRPAVASAGQTYNCTSIKNREDE